MGSVLGTDVVNCIDVASKVVVSDLLQRIVLVLLFHEQPHASETCVKISSEDL